MTTSGSAIDMGVHHTYRYINTGNFVNLDDYEKLKKSVGQYAYGTLSGSTYYNNYRFYVTYASNGIIKLLGNIKIGPYNYLDMCGYTWTVTFAANQLTSKTKTVTGCKIPTVNQLNNVAQSYRILNTSDYNWYVTSNYFDKTVDGSEYKFIYSAYCYTGEVFQNRESYNIDNLTRYSVVYVETTYNELNW